MKRNFILHTLTAPLRSKAAPLAALFASLAFAANAQVGIGTLTPDASAQLDVKSDSKGVLVPRLTSAQRTGIPAPADGLLVYDTDTKSFWFFKSGTGWAKIDPETLALPYAGTETNAGTLFSVTNQGAGAALEGVAGTAGPAGRFLNTNAANTEGNVVTVETNGSGNIPDRTKGHAASFRVSNSESVAAAVRGEVNTIFGNFGAAGIFGVSNGTGGLAGLFHASNTNGNGAALVAISDGNGIAFRANAAKGNAVEANVDATGDAIYGWVPTFATGRAGHFEIYNEDNGNDAITVKTVGNGTAGRFIVDRTTGTSPAVYGEVNSMFANLGTAGIYGRSSGTAGYAGLFYSSNPSGNGPAMLALTEGNGNGLTANAGGSGDGVEASADGAGNAISGFIPNFGTGRAGRFANNNANNGNPAVHVSNAGSGPSLLVQHSGGASGNLAIFQNNTANVARINKAGVGFFNGGTQNSGADIAEAFDVIDEVSEYEPGDVLSIATSKDRTIEKSAGAYSDLVLGVYATKPGVLLTEENIDTDLTGKVPMGVVGVIPTKVCGEGGAIQRGDLLVTSSTPGVAMKADKAKVQAGQILGKALQNFDGDGIGKINVFVNVK
ncbi:hypothetical protein SAMN05216327_102294 [Dyadobacter sp. SG02]|uniref:hypothetical protein n=1 Tax=Dyadobacter sp. SG02 TaxID=1855291 RepID=UPI0008B0EE86|nr:hypothetical protein [Dyadobacter sp. SG02]SEI53481.1 hypothetical protein SAMN05216327_102294 [Dyadobacter sp. SG02]